MMKKRFEFVRIFPICLSGAKVQIVIPPMAGPPSPPVRK